MPNISLETFLSVAERDTTSERTIKLGGKDGVKHVGWPTWKKTNRAAVSAFFTALTNKYGADVANMVRNKRMEFVESSKPLTSRLVKDMDEEAKKNVCKQKIMDFLTSTSQDPNESAYAYCMSFRATKWGKNMKVSKDFLENAIGTCIHYRKERIGWIINKMRAVFSLEMMKSIMSCEINDQISRCFAWFNTVGKLQGWSQAIFDRMSTHHHSHSDGLGNFGNFLQMKCKEDGNEGILVRTLENTRQIYRDIAEEAHCEPQEFTTMEEYDLASAELMSDIGKKNKDLNKMLGSWKHLFSNDGKQLSPADLQRKEKVSSFMVAVKEEWNEILLKRPAYKAIMFGDMNTLEDVANEPALGSFMTLLMERVEHYPKEVTPSLLRTIMNEFMEDYCERRLIAQQCLDQQGIVVDKAEKGNQIERIGLFVNRVFKRTPAKHTELLSASFGVEREVVRKKIEKDVLDLIAAREEEENLLPQIREDAKREIAEYAKLSQEEKDAINLCWLNEHLTYVAGEYRNTQDLKQMLTQLKEGYTETKNKFVAVRKGLFEILKSKKSAMASWATDRLREIVIESPLISKVDFLSRAFDIAEKLDLRVLRNLTSQSSYNDKLDAIVSLAKQVDKLKTDGERVLDAQPAGLMDELIVTIFLGKPENADICEVLLGENHQGLDDAEVKATINEMMERGNKTEKYGLANQNNPVAEEGVRNSNRLMSTIKSVLYSTFSVSKILAGQ